MPSRFSSTTEFFMSKQTAHTEQAVLSDTWQPIETAPKDRYILGCEIGMKRPYIMIWNVHDQCFSVSYGMEDERPTHWLDLPPVPR